MGLQANTAAPAGVAAASAAITRVVTADPAANAEISYTLLKPLHLKAATLQIVQGITDTPQVILSITNASDVEVYRSFGASAAQAVSTTANYTWASGLALSGLVGTTPNIYAQAPLPEDLVLPAGYKIKTITLGKGAATDLGVLSLFGVEYTT